MTDDFVFDKEVSKYFNDRRIEALDRFLPDMIEAHNIETSLDVGCGVGYFSDYLQGLGLDTVALDAREENIAEAVKRHPGIKFHVHDVQNPSMKKLGSFDLVLCLGLLYHLENPFQAIRNMEAMTKKILIIESMITPSPLPISTLFDEGRSEDQSLNYVAFVPSETCIIKMLYQAGFSSIYRIIPLPDHDDFKGSLTYKRRRTMLLVSRQELQAAFLQPMPEPHIEDLWQKRWGRFVELMHRVGAKIKRSLKH